MEPRLREYIENLFAGAPHTKQSYELREEIIRNTIDRYHDLIAEGKTENDAYNLAIAGIGDISELVEALGGEPVADENYSERQLESVKSRKTIFTTIAVALYILCVTPCIAFSAMGADLVGPVLMFFMISIATGLLIYSHITRYLPVVSNENEVKNIKRNAYLKSVAVGMYISCVTPCIIFADTRFTSIGVVFMFMMVALATAMIIFSRKDLTNKNADDTMVESYKEWSSQNCELSLLYKILVAILWVAASTFYIIVTVYGVFNISTAIIAVSWIIFLIAVALQNLMRAIFEYVEVKKCENQQKTEL